MSVKRYSSAGSGSGGRQLPFSRAVEAGGFLYVSGQVAMENGEIVGQGIVEQTRKTIDNLQAILEEAGYSLADVVKVNCWLDDPRDFWSFNGVFESAFGSNPPARSTVQTQLVVDAKVEMDLIAYRPPQA